MKTTMILVMFGLILTSCGNGDSYGNRGYVISKTQAEVSEPEVTLQD